MNAYVPSVCLMLGAAVAMRSIASFARCVFAGLLHALAMLFHQLAFVFLAVAWTCLPPSASRVTAYYVTAMLPVIFVYFYAFTRVSRTPTLQGLFQWITYHSPDSTFVFDPLAGVILTIRGTLRLLAGGKLSSFVNEPSSIAALCVLTAIVNALSQQPLRSILPWLVAGIGCWNYAFVA